MAENKVILIDQGLLERQVDNPKFKTMTEKHLTLLVTQLHLLSLEEQLKESREFMLALTTHRDSIEKDINIAQHEWVQAHKEWQDGVLAGLLRHKEESDESDLD